MRKEKQMTFLRTEHGIYTDEKHVRKKDGREENAWMDNVRQQLERFSSEALPQRYLRSKHIFTAQR